MYNFENERGGGFLSLLSAWMYVMMAADRCKEALCESLCMYK